MNQARLDELVIESFAGEWGSGEGDTAVIRNTNFCPDGSLDLSNIAYRDIPLHKVLKKALRSGDLIIEKSGGSPNQPVGRVVAFEEDGTYVCNNFTAVLRFGNRADHRYMLHLLRRLYHTGAMAPYQNKTTGIINLKLKAFLKDTVISLPPIEEQKRIAAILDKADRLRTLRQQTIGKLDQLAQSIFLDMFGDPVTNPKGWEIAEMGTVCDVRDGTHESPKYVTKGFPLVTSKNLTKGYVDLRSVKLISQTDYLAINRRSKVDVGDILMPMIGTIGGPVLIMEEPNFAVKNVAIIKPIESSPDFHYLQTLLNSHYLSHITGQTNRGGTQHFISLGDLRSLPIPIPDRGLQDHFRRSRLSVLATKERLHRDSQLQTNLSGALSQRAFKGEL